MTDLNDINGIQDDAGDSFLVLVMRYFDGDLSAVELAEFNVLLRCDETCRRRFVEFCTRGCLIRETFEPERQALLRHEQNAAKAAIAEDGTPSDTTHSGAAPKRRRSVQILALVASVGIAITAVLVGIWLAGKDDGAVVIGSLERISGDVHVLSAGGDVRLVEASSPIRAGDTVRIRGARSEAIFVFSDDTKINLVGDTSITCGSRDSTRVVIHQGTLSVSAKPQRKGQPLILTTSAAQMEVLGTQFLVEAGADQTDLSVLEGRVRVTRVSDGKAVDVEKGKRLLTAGREEFVVQDIRKPADTWDLDFEDGLPKDFVRGRFVKEGLPTGSKGAVAAIRADHGQYGFLHEIGTSKNWNHGLFAVCEDSHLHFTYKMDRPDWLNVFIIARGPDPGGPHSGNYLFAEPVFRRPAGKWQTLTIPFSEFRRAGSGKGPPPSVNEIPYMVLFSSDEDRGLVIDRMWVTRGGPRVVQFKDVE